jgi:hypothetical protein
LQDRNLQVPIMLLHMLMYVTSLLLPPACCRAPGSATGLLLLPVLAASCCVALGSQLLQGGQKWIANPLANTPLSLTSCACSILLCCMFAPCRDQGCCSCKQGAAASCCVAELKVSGLQQ